MMAAVKVPMKSTLLLYFDISKCNDLMNKKKGFGLWALSIRIDADLYMTGLAGLKITVPLYISWP